MIYVNILFLLV